MRINYRRKKRFPRRPFIFSLMVLMGIMSISLWQASSFLSSFLWKGPITEKVRVSGRHFCPSEPLLKIVSACYKKPFWSCSIHHVQEEIQDIDWIKTVHVERRYPKTLQVHITERQPIARWQKGKEIFLIDTEGRLIEMTEPRLFAHLPLCSGDQASSHMFAFLTLLDRYPGLKNRITLYSWIRHRRWDISIQNVRIHLPEERLAEALSRLHTFLQFYEHALANFKSIDLRFSGKILCRSHECLQRRPKPKGQAT